jgi:hypothetical protein
MPGLLDLPTEVLEDIAFHAASERKNWCSNKQKTVASELSLRLIHPRLTAIFTISFFKHCTIVINPRNHEAISSLSAFCAAQDVERYVTSLVLHAPNFIERTTGLEEEALQLVKQFHKLEKLDLNLDGHFVGLDIFSPMDNLRSLTLQGESFFCELQALPAVAPRLSHLQILSPSISSTPPSSPSEEYAQASKAMSMEGKRKTNHLTHLHISNLNNPNVQTLLVDLPFQPVYFSFSLMHNYDLTELGSLLCRDAFCQRTVSVKLVSSKMVAPDRLRGFKALLHEGLSRAQKTICIGWSEG